MFQIYDLKTIQKGKLALLSETNMVDFALDMHKELYSDQEGSTGIFSKLCVLSLMYTIILILFYFHIL